MNQLTTPNSAVARTAASSSSKSKQLKTSDPNERLPHCQRCSQHGRRNRLRGHKAVCEFRDCRCPKCLIVVERQRLMADQIKLRRKQRKLRNLHKLQSVPSIEQRAVEPAVEQALGIDPQKSSIQHQPTADDPPKPPIQQQPPSSLEHPTPLFAPNLWPPPADSFRFFSLFGLPPFPH
ncbi:Doublesex-and mab-3-related transcription factor 3 [Aphelenchoides fujianensis]|nr:Doublesex-and mab-3-related transcription factor 3 [Aphelenchoides fujianensis]